MVNGKVVDSHSHMMASVTQGGKNQRVEIEKRHNQPVVAMWTEIDVPSSK